MSDKRKLALHKRVTKQKKGKNPQMTEITTEDSGYGTL
jgi:hypothetical protein